MEGIDSRTCHVQKLVSKKTGLSEEMAQVAVNTVVEYLKDKLPGPAGAQLDALLDGGDVADFQL